MLSYFLAVLVAQAEGDSVRAVQMILQQSVQQVVGTSPIQVVADGGVAVVSCPPASGTDGGCVTAHAQTIGGNKTFADAVLLDGGVTIGLGGSPLTFVGWNCATLNFSNIILNACPSATFTVQGAVVGDFAVYTWPSTLAAGLKKECTVSAPNTAEVTLCNLLLAPGIDPAAGEHCMMVFRRTP